MALSFRPNFAPFYMYFSATYRSYTTPVDALFIPTGAFEPVEGSPYDFEVVDSISSRLFEIDSDPVGYDINYVLWGYNGSEAKDLTHDCIIFDK